jgi:hypothetical protein
MIELLDKIERVRVNPALWMAAGTEASKLSDALSIQNNLSHDRSGGIACAQEQDIKNMIRHGAYSPAHSMG